MSDELDRLLGQPLPPVADDGFSARLMRHALWERRFHAGLLAALGAACLFLAFALAPLRHASTDIAVLLPQIAGSAAVNMAAAILVLIFLLERQFSRL
ncbi:MAG: hypothetical protein KGJ78_08095 [Alphaproteobacteria bacterium]|nr:hypothetical protein [Alphaproteobacteria bacterium]